MSSGSDCSIDTLQRNDATVRAAHGVLKHMMSAQRLITDVGVKL